MVIFCISILSKHKGRFMQNIVKKIDKSFPNFDIKTDPDLTNPELYNAIVKLWDKGPLAGIRANGCELVYVDAKTGARYRFGSDCMINLYTDYDEKRHGPEKLQNSIRQIKQQSEMVANYDKYYPIGASIIFPRGCEKWWETINITRGWRWIIGDRIDLTMECIRLYYDDKESPLTDVFKDKINKWFLDLFGSFPAYIDFFMLNDLIGDDGKINFFLPFNGFQKTESGWVLKCGTEQRSHAYPTSEQEWWTLFDAEISFMNARSKSIYKKCKF